MGRFAQVVVEEDQSLLALVNYVGQPRLALPTLVSYPRSYDFRSGGREFVFDTSTKRLVEPCADERERAMGFLIGTTSALGLIELQRRQVLGQAMDLTSMTWFLGVCLAAQMYNKGGYEGHLGAHVSGQGAEYVVPSMMGNIASSTTRVWHDSREAWG